MQEDPQVSIPFYRSRKKELKEKIENIQAYVKTNKDSSKWSVVYIDDKKDIFSFYGKEENTDKNRLDLIPVLELMEWINEDGKKKNLTVYTSSIYVINCINEWMDKWKRYDFKISENKERPNTDILKRIEDLKKSISISVKLLTVDNSISQLSSSVLEDV